jgi:hypothetical protein
MTSSWLSKTVASIAATRKHFLRVLFWVHVREYNRSENILDKIKVSTAHTNF